MERKLYRLSFIVILAVSLEFVHGQQPSVGLNVGTLNGLAETVSIASQDYTVHKYLGIPFAKPPVGDLRLRKPVAVESLETNPYNATYHRAYCVQGFYEQPVANGQEDEDCLYLNVYVPDQAPDDAAGHAVMVWVYGGGYSIGAADSFDGSVLAAKGNVIVVTLNYRLTFFGFFSTMDSAAQGNYGLFDQAMAFQWVSDNIGGFGGDNQRVTIFGQSAGGMSVDFHALYPQNHGLFQRIITESGVAPSPYLDMARDRTRGIQVLSSHLNCSADYSENIVDCLRSKSWLDIKNAILQITSDIANWDALFLMPIVDYDIIPLDYMNLKERQGEIFNRVEFYQSLDVMHGSNRYDGGTFLNLVVGSLGGLNDWMPTQEEMSTYISYLRTITADGPYPDHIRDVIHHEYTDWENPSSLESVRLQMADLFTDYVYAVPVAQSAEVHYSSVGSSSTYVYRFLPATSGRLPYQPGWLTGADHSEELMMVFGMGFNSMSAEEQALSITVMTYWSNFAKTG